jgi:hypothetical protein
MRRSKAAVYIHAASLMDFMRSTEKGKDQRKGAALAKQRVIHTLKREN